MSQDDKKARGLELPDNELRALIFLLTFPMAMIVLAFPYNKHYC